MRIIQQAELVLGNPDDRTIRDGFMADNVAWLLEQAGVNGKIVAWAHNGHVAAYPNGGSMGSFLREKFRQDLVSVAFEFHGGEFIALDWDGSETAGLRMFEAPPPPKGSMADLLQAAEMPILVLDLRSATESFAAEWLNRPQPIHYIGAVYEGKCPGAFFYSVIPAKTWDVMIYFENTTAAQYLREQVSPGGETVVEQVTLGPTNLGFEAGTICWHFPQRAVKDYLWKLDHDVARSGQNSVSIHARHGDAEEGFLWQMSDIMALQGQRVRISMALKVSENPESVALVFSEFVHQNEFVHQTIVDQNLLADKNLPEWFTVELIVDVSVDATNIAFGVKLLGSGQIWVDDFTIEVIDPEG
jgi:hypothetical protein